MKKVLLLLIFSISLFSVANSQNRFGKDGLLSDIKEQISFKVTPTIPSANEVVSFNVESFSTDLNKADIVWYVNNVETLRGVGEINFSTTAPGVGNNLIVEVIIKTIEGNTITDEYSITPGYVTLVSEPNSYVPPFYKGKSLLPKQGFTKIIAVPNIVINGSFVPKENLIYTWSVDGRVIQSASGYGKYTYYHKGDILSKDKVISVEVSSQSSNSKTEGFIYINHIEPEVVIYEKNTAFGVIERSLSGLTNNLMGAEIELIAYPFFIGTTNGFSSDINYDWKINGLSILEEINNQPYVLFRNDNGDGGQASISIRVKNVKETMQEGSTSSILLFKNPSTQGSDFSF